MSEFHNRGYPSSVPFGELGRIPVHVPRGSLNLPYPHEPADKPEDVEDTNNQDRDTAAIACLQSLDYPVVDPRRAENQRNATAVAERPMYRRHSVLPDYDEIVTFVEDAAEAARHLGTKARDSDYIQGFRGFFDKDYTELPESRPHETTFRVHLDTDGGIGIDWRTAADYHEKLTQDFDFAREAMTPAVIRKITQVYSSPLALQTEAAVLVFDMMVDLPVMDGVGATSLIWLAGGILTRRRRHQQAQNVAEPETTRSIMKRAVNGDKGLYIMPDSYDIASDNFMELLPDEFPVVHSNPIATDNIFRQISLLDERAAAQPGGHHGASSILNYTTHTSEGAQKRVKLTPARAIGHMLATVHPDEQDEFITNTYAELLDLHFAQGQALAAHSANEQLDMIIEDSVPPDSRDGLVADVDASCQQILKSTLAIGAKWIDHKLHSALKRRPQPL